MVLHKETDEVLISKLSILEVFSSVFTSCYSRLRLNVTHLQILPAFLKFEENPSF
jgi:hypothetical protein